MNFVPGTYILIEVIMQLINHRAYEFVVVAMFHLIVGVQNVVYYLYLNLALDVILISSKLVTISGSLSRIYAGCEVLC